MKKHIITILLTGSLLVTLLPMNLQAAATTDQTVETEAGGDLDLPVLVQDDSVYASSLSLRKTAPAAEEDWEIYRSDYCYNNLSEDQKALYDGLDQMCMYYAAGSNNISYDDSMKAYCMPGVGYENLSPWEVYQTLYAFLFQNPQYYFLDKGWASYSASNQAVALTVYNSFALGSSRTTATNTMFAEVDSMLETITASGNVLEQEKKAHDLIINKVTYDSDTYDQSAYSVFAGSKTVCAGYSQAFALLMNASGIATTCTTSEEHEWNKIELYGNWYNIDLTWDDTDSSPSAIYTFFNRSDDGIKSISALSSLHHTEEDWWTNIQPAATLDSGATETDMGKICTQSITATDLSKVTGSVFNLSAASDDTTAALTYSSSDTSVATVDEETGEVTTLKPGITTISITASETDTSKEAVTSVTLTVKPKKAGIRSVTSTSSGTITLNWKKQTNVTGYIINISKSETFSTYRSIYISDSSVVSRKITNLTSGKKYYLRIRAVVKTDSGVTIRGAWSGRVSTKAN